MRSSRFLSIIGVIALLTSVLEAKDEKYVDDPSVSTLTITRTLFGKPTAISTVVPKSPKSEDKNNHSSRDRDENHEYHTTIHHTYDSPRVTEGTSTHHIIETHRPSYAPSNSARPSIITVRPSASSRNEDVVTKTITKKQKSKSKNRHSETPVIVPVSSRSASAVREEIHTVFASSSAAASHPAPVVVVVTSSGMRSLVTKNPANMASVSSKMATALPSSSSISSSIPPAAAPPSPAPMETAIVSSAPAVATTGHASSAMAAASPSAGGASAGSAMPSALTPSPSILLSSSGPAKPSSDVNNVNNKKIGPSSSPSTANSGQSDKLVGSSLVLAWVVAAVAAF